MNLAERIDLLTKLGKYLQQGEEDWKNAKRKAFEKNGWFTPEFIDHSVKNIITEFLQKDKLEQ